MLKRIVSIVIITAMLCGGCAVYADENREYREYYNKFLLRYAAPSIFENMSDNLSRGLCVSSIMRVIGVDEKSAFRVDDALYESFPYHDEDLMPPVSAYVRLSKRCISTGYSNLPRSYVSLGIIDPDDTETAEYDYFLPNKDVTIKECLTFMLRCIKKREDVKWDSVMDDSVSVGFLTADERERIDEDAPITKGQFSRVLSRLFGMKRYLYYVPDETDEMFEYDENRSISYADMFEEFIRDTSYLESE